MPSVTCAIGSFCPSRHLSQRFRDLSGYIQIQIPDPRDFVDVNLVRVLGILSILRLKLNNLPKRSGVEELAPRMEYMLDGAHRILVHLVGSGETDR